jgi:hypothetical protein
MEQQFVLELTQYAITGIAVVFSVFTLVGAFRSGALTKIKMGNLEIASNNVENQNIRSAIENSVSGKDDIPKITWPPTIIFTFEVDTFSV